MDDIKYYENVIAKLESKVDLLEAELVYLDKILVNCGFPEGIQTLKQIVDEMLTNDVDRKELID